MSSKDKESRTSKDEKDVKPKKERDDKPISLLKEKPGERKLEEYVSCYTCLLRVIFNAV